MRGSQNDAKSFLKAQQTQRQERMLDNRKAQGGERNFSRTLRLGGLSVFTKRPGGWGLCRRREVDKRCRETMIHRTGGLQTRPPTWGGSWYNLIFAEGGIENARDDSAKTRSGTPYEGSSGNDVHVAVTLVLG